MDFCCTLWITAIANFGGKPSKPTKNWPGKITIFTILLAGSIIWISFRSMLTASLSVVTQKKPFNSLETFLQSDYRYSKEQMKPIRSHIVKQNGDFQEGIS